MRPITQARSLRGGIHPLFLIKDPCMQRIPLQSHTKRRRPHAAFFAGKAQHGFTLVEIAIVLVIIGLLLGGVLKGQEMITQARIKNIINDFNGITAAVYAYQDRYRALAGDDMSAATRWVANNAVSGNGDGQWASTRGYATVLGGTPTVADEANLFWWHLRLAGFIPGTTVAGAAAGAQPANAVNGILGVQTGAGASTLGFASNIICSSNLPDKVASAIDTQMDDGAMQTGMVRSSGPQVAPNPALAALPGGATTYVENGTDQYTICKQL
jgi:prepilin-type N-terminal cleavage/methylation domain-containing protein